MKNPKVKTNTQGKDLGISKYCPNGCFQLFSKKIEINEFCVYCGRELQLGCFNCGEEITENQKFCVLCGESLEKNKKDV